MAEQRGSFAVLYRESFGLRPLTGADLFFDASSAPLRVMISYVPCILFSVYHFLYVIKFNRAMRFKANKMGFSLNQRGLFQGVVRDPQDRRIKTNAGER